MADMMSTLRGFLGDGADEKIQGALEMLKSSGMMDDSGKKTQDGISASKSEINVNTGNNTSSGLPNLNPEGFEMIGQIKGVFDRISNSNDSRSNLLLSLKPFMRADRQRSIDRVAKMMNIARLSGLFGK